MLGTRYNFIRSQETNRGFSFLDTIIGIALMSIVFFALLSAFRFSITLLGLAKTEITGVALADEQMEYLRSIDYDSIGTLSGIPAGIIPQTESITLNNVPYTRRTLIQYVDAPEDGEGAADQNSLTADYKVVKVEIDWTFRDVAHTYSLVSIMVPKGVESVSGGGTLRVYAVSALGDPISGASVRIQNTVTSPTIDVTVSTNSDGKVEFPGGTPAASGYQVTVSKDGYSTAGTYTVSGSDPNPVPGPLTVVSGGTTSSTFSIDLLGGMIVKTYSPVSGGTWSDSLNDSSQTSLMASTTIASGAATLAIDPSTSDYSPSGEVQSITVAPAYLTGWNDFSWNDTRPANTDIRYRVYYWNGSAFALIPDSDLPGNAAGATSSPLSLSALAPSTYSSLRVDATLSASIGSTTPEVNDWSLGYEGGPTPLPNIPFSFHGLKTIGTDGSGASIYKYSGSGNSGASGSVAIPALEWDTYPVTVSSATGYDISESCLPQPTNITPGATTTVSLLLSPHTTNSLLVSVTDQSGVPVAGASLHLYGGSIDSTLSSSACGQAFFPGLTSSDSYSLDVTKGGFQTTSNTLITVSGAQTMAVTLNP
jgi:hypothetical protein